MKNLAFHNRPRSVGAQLARMKRWPSFEIINSREGIISWVGSLRGFQLFYKVGVLWDPSLTVFDRPYVLLLNPELKPRLNGSFEEIPHLMYCAERPDQSGLCLFDPEGNEWSSHMLIADTTIPWAAKWLYFYELWHYDGVWRGGGVGFESIAKARAEVIHGEESEQSSASKKEAPMAVKQTLQDSFT